MLASLRLAGSSFRNHSTKISFSTSLITSAAASASAASMSTSYAKQFEAAKIADYAPSSFSQHLCMTLHVPFAHKEIVGLTDSHGHLHELTPTEVAHRPTVLRVSDGKLDRNAYYHVIMTDPDAPSPNHPTAREWLHWIDVNIRPKDDETIDPATGDEAVTYVSSAPPQGSGKHRYHIYLFKTEKPIDVTEKIGMTGQGRPKWSINSFAHKYGLHDPVAIAGFLAEYDKHCDVVYSHLK